MRFSFPFVSGPRFSFESVKPKPMADISNPSVPVLLRRNQLSLSLSINPLSRSAISSSILYSSLQLLRSVVFPPWNPPRFSDPSKGVKDFTLILKYKIFCVDFGGRARILLAGADKSLQGPIQKINVQNSTLPNGFETFILEVCDETDVAELKLKVGDFEMLLKRDVGTPKAPTSIAPLIESPTTAPPIPSEPMVELASASLPVVSQKSDPPAISPFTNVSAAMKSKLTVLEASGSNAYVLVSSPTVGSFRSGRTLKGKKQPPSCKEGDIIKEGQIIGFLDQFGNELPVRLMMMKALMMPVCFSFAQSDVAGEVLKVLFKDEEYMESHHISYSVILLVYSYLQALSIQFLNEAEYAL
ncbi:hypothetical protein COCNU_12G002200 [Cocos nucifera]|uniref:Biotin carboxyl carrier protein n=1 Tax=Cocos nucifera TaxID=13894 RepID=A0A8K0IQN1_COCNU|nr:hypothetical protein COCNU_12G002200 [Cocos nucifera]